MSEQSLHPTVLDSDAQQVGALYAKALLGSAGDSVDDIVAEFEAIVEECLDQFPNLEQALASPRISQEQKEGMLERIFRGKVSDKLLNFLKILCRRDRISSLRAIQVTATQMRGEQLGRKTVTVSTAQPLTDEQKSQIAAGFQAAFGQEAVLVEKIEPDLLGGVVLRVDDQVIDGSALGKLESIRSAVTDGVQKAIRDRFESLISS